MYQNRKSHHVLHTQFIVLSLLIFGVFSTSTAQNAARFAAQNSQSGFVENLGQFQDMDGNAVPNVLFVEELPQVDIFITTEGITMLLLQSSPANENTNHKKNYIWERIDIFLADASILPENISTAGASGKVNHYFNAQTPEGVHANAFGYIKINNVYPGIDWELYTINGNSLKYNFIINAGANSTQIKLRYGSAIPITLDTSNNIVMHTILGEIIDSAPITFLTDNGTSLNSNYVLHAIDEHVVEVTFETENYDISNSITIDPELYWCTYYGGNKEECFNSVITDADGNLIAVGWTDSPNFPTLTAGTYYQGTLAALEDAMIVKFSPTEERIWSTFYGGTHEDWAYSVTTDASNNIFVSGETVSGNFPVLNAGTFYQGGLNGDEDVFILKFDAAGNRLWATFYGGDKKEGGHSITTDPSGNIFVTGYTESTDFPKLNAGTFYQATMSGVQDAFVLKFTNAGTRVWATYYGGSLYDAGNSIASDASGNIFITGDTRSTNFPVLDAATFYQGTMAGDTDVYILKFTNTGTRLWATYYGGADAEYGNSIITDVNDNIYIAGWTRSADFPTLDIGEFYQSTRGGLSDAYIAKFDNGGIQLWSTYFGGAAIENAYKWDMLAEDFCGNVYLAITTFSTGMPVYNAGCSSYYDATYEANGDIFITRFTDYGLITWATYYGFDNEELDACIHISKLDGKSLYMTGQYNEYDPGAPVPMVDPGGTAYYDGSHNGDNEAFVGKFMAVPLTLTTENSNICGCIDTAVAIPDCGVAPYEYLWSDGQTTATAEFLCPDNYTVTVTDADCNIVVGAVDIICPLPVDIISFTALYQNKAVLLRWEAQSEFNTAMYFLEKSYDGELFQQIGIVYAFNSGSAPVKYTYLDEDVSAGIIYYKLVAVDLDNHGEDKGTVSIEIDVFAHNLTATVIAPNTIQFSFIASENTEGNLQISGITGALIFTANLPITAGENTIIITIPNIESGIYFGKITNYKTVYATDFMYLNR